jgi:hypothetical protein
MLRISGTGRTKKPHPLTGLIFLSLTLVFAAVVFLRPLAQAYYGTDDRKELFQLSGQDLEDADSVVALFPDFQVVDRGDGTSGS